MVTLCPVFASTRSKRIRFVMASKIRVLLVDDSAVIRRLLTDVLSGDPTLEIVGGAPNGRVALEQLPVLKPDLVVLDVEMPEMDGLETLTEIRKRQPRLPVIMFSSLTERGAIVTLEALALGANDYVTKPSNTGNMLAALQRVREELIPRIKTFCRHLLDPAPTPLQPTERLVGFKPFATSGSSSGVPSPAPVPIPATPPFPTTDRFTTTTPSSPRQRIEVVAVGVSTGGPNALAAILSQFPAQFPAPVLVVQHMPALFTRLLAERLAAQSALSVAEGADGEDLAPGLVRLAPGGLHMTVERRGTRVRIRLDQSEPENSCRPAANVLFQSVAEAYGGGALAVVLTGMGNDGLRGCEAIRKAGGQILVQDEASSVVWSMPGCVARAGLADGEIALPRLAGEILRRVRTGS